MISPTKQITLLDTDPQRRGRTPLTPGVLTLSDVRLPRETHILPRQTVPPTSLS